MSLQKERYFIAIVPKAPLSDKINQLKLEVFDRFGSKASLRSPPHITLQMPFLKPESKEKQIIDCLEGFTLEFKPFSIELNGFGFFEPRVIFISVEPNNDLNNLQKRLEVRLKKSLNLNFKEKKENRLFHPHITIAFRDLKKGDFYKAKEIFQHRTFEAQFEVNELTLLKHDGKRWNVRHNFSLGSTRSKGNIHSE